MIGCTEKSKAKQGDAKSGTPTEQGEAQSGGERSVGGLPPQEIWQAGLKSEAQTFPASATLTDVDAAVQAAFGKACQNIVKLQGLTFKDASAAYLCQSFLNRDTPDAAVTAAFPAAEIESADILAHHGFMGKGFAAIILTNTGGAPDAVILRRTVAQPLLQSLDSSAAAAAWAYLQGITGEGFHAKNLATAKVTETNEGWKFDDAEAFINCKPTQTLSFTVSKSGKITELARADKKNADGTMTAICID